MEWGQCLYRIDLGEDCAGFEGLDACRAGGECRGGICAQPFSPECDAANPACPAGKFCDTVGQECINQIAVGDFCNGFSGMSDVCQPPATCVNDECVLTTTAAPSTTTTTTTTQQPQKNADDCARDEDCNSSSFCDTVYRSCLARLPDGEPCEGLEDFPRACLDGSTCIDSFCRPTTPPTTTPIPGYCEDIDDCESGQFCDLEFSACLAQIPIGGPCEGLEAIPSACADGGQCKDNFCKDNSPATTTTTTTTTAAPASTDCVTSSDCGPGQFCDTTYSTCEVQIAPGEACEGLGSIPDVCKDGGSCNGVFCQTNEATTTAAPMTTTAAPSGTCQSSAECDVTAFCDTEYQECISKIPGGDDCEGFEAFSDVCEAGFKCVDAVCREDEKKETTEPEEDLCSASADCETDFFCDVKYGECLKKIPEGEPCAEWDDVPDVCASGTLCRNDVCAKEAVATTEGPPVDEVECDETKPCPAGEFCDTEFKECSDQIFIGDSCEGLESQPNVCEEDGVCDSGICIRKPSVVTTTTPPVPTTTTTTASENACQSNADCDETAFFCDAEFDECVLRLRDGDNCEEVQDNPLACEDHLNCLPEGVCGIPEPTCDSDAECDEGFFCHRGEQRCLPYLPVGGPCPSLADARSPCVEGATCDQVSGRCLLITTSTSTTTPITTPPTTTTPTPSCIDTGCPFASFCDAEYGECVPVFKLGEQCTGFEAAGIDLICEGVTTCRNGVCANPPTTTTTTTTTTPKPTTPTTQPSRPDVGSSEEEEESAPFPVVYFTVSIIRGNYNFYKQPVPGATVYTQGQNVPNGYTQRLAGKTSLSSAYPYYTGAAVVRVMDPRKAGYFPLVPGQGGGARRDGAALQAHVLPDRQAPVRLLHQRRPPLHQHLPLRPHPVQELQAGSTRRALDSQGRLHASSPPRLSHVPMLTLSPSLSLIDFNPVLWLSIVVSVEFKLLVSCLPCQVTGRLALVWWYEIFFELAKNRGVLQR